jgi:hypothetical protein
MTKTVKEIVDEYLARQKNAVIENMGMTVDSDRLRFSNVNNITEDCIPVSFSDIDIGNYHVYEFYYTQKVPYGKECGKERPMHYKCEGWIHSISESA